MLRYRPRSDSQEEETEEVPDFDTLPRVYVERTLAIIKPDAVHKSEEIEDVILKEGFTILQVGLVCFSNQFENTDKNNMFQVHSVSAPPHLPQTCAHHTKQCGTSSGTDCCCWTFTETVIPIYNVPLSIIVEPQ